MKMTLWGANKCLSEYGSVIIMCHSRAYIYKKEIPKAKIIPVDNSYKGINSPVIVSECAFQVMSENMKDDIEAHNDKFLKKFDEGK